MKNKTQHLNQGPAYAWMKELPPQQRAAFVGVLGPMLSLLGYTVNGSTPNPTLANLSDQNIDKALAVVREAAKSYTLQAGAI